MFLVAPIYVSVYTHHPQKFITYAKVKINKIFGLVLPLFE